MSIEETVLVQMQSLPNEQKQEILDFVEFLKSKELEKRKLSNGHANSLLGKYAHLGIHISADEIDQARQEAWANFPRDINP